ncbi:MAG: hypothetical protein OXD32_08245 [Endozoicomonadaceae bacterium]|nr:hypothetical protein [Endozoicomonadaceae bacterium]
MKYIKNIVMPDRLLLCWQSLKNIKRSRFIVGELVKESDSYKLNYFTENEDFKKATDLGFIGYPAFPYKGSEKTRCFDNNVIGTFQRRLPPSRRRDYSLYLELRGLKPESCPDDFCLLGYTGAKIENDGFELIHPFENVGHAFQFILEIAGFNRASEVAEKDLKLESEVEFSFEPDNENDLGAVVIMQDGKKLGYVDHGRVSIFHCYIKAGRTVKGEIIRKNGTPDRPQIYVYVSVSH